MKAETCLRGPRERAPIRARRLQQGVGAYYIGVHEGRGAVDGTVDMGLGGEVHDGVGPVGLEYAADLHRVADIDLLEMVTGRIRNVGQGFEITGVGQLVEIDDLGLGALYILAYDGRADEAGTASDDDFQLLALDVTFRKL